MRLGAAVLASVSLLVPAAGPAGGSAAVPAPDAPPPLPERMADTGGGSQLITARAARTSSTTGTVTWWDRRGRDGRWVAAGSAPARFGAKGLVEGGSRRQGTNTTPTGLYDLPYAFGIRPAPEGTSTSYRRVTRTSWWCQDNDSRSYNRWTDPRPADCRAAESEHLITYGTQYAYALVIGFNYARPVQGRGAGIFLHVNGTGPTAGCVSVPEDAMRRILDWAEPAREPHIAIGTDDGPTSITG
ncbi:L,D-peptidoglycan transpeptidase YkuD (ErfK/YbiS/YcfS/YnhG family) [Streptomyces aurantiacus]|uniref:L,D-transpeptidase family protein n=1 Tax=Streptomyces aurantiacus TaxID=47760 RepID=UPI00279149F2|nr:L,D-transpeptidase family protein [Streptomyces aurantiacus]MDQ0778511.1 L,D-peptidoglycan transpeptidase YkuD (ErfK/YbiS/YcfS/YnhG family) [Streptomyces aurantiacus]